jgi:pyruvate dehydrogenase E2 component (dihydrolipoamide acetyltransferase)
MPIDITMPALSPTMEEGKLAKWHVKEGDSVSSGDVIAEIETDKATMEVEAVDEGKIGKIMVAEGTDGVKVNAVIAVLLQEGEDASAVSSTGKAQEKAAPTASTEAPEADAGTLMYDKGTDTTSSAPVDAKVSAQPPAPKAQKSEAPAGKVFASPLARRLAKEAGLDVASIAGSGPKGRVIKADIEAAKSGKGSAKVAPTAAAASAGGAPTAGGMSKQQVLAMFEEGTYELVPNDGMRKTVAARLTESKQTVPHFYLTVDCRIDALLAAREQINAQAPKNKEGKPAYKLSVNDFVMKAWAVALQRVPAANATWAGDSILYHKRSDVAVAVAVPGGLFTPVVKSADTKTLREISEEVKDLATRARNKKLAPHEYQGGATSVSNLGMFGIKHFSAVINPPHGTILAVGAGEERVFPENGQVKIGQFMTVTLSCDHRAVDGALGAEVLGVFKGLIETPVMMLA